jgi:hypothetical protein
MVAVRDLTPNEFLLLVYVGLSGADKLPGGLATTNVALAEALGVHSKTIRRALVRLRDAGLIAFDEHERVAGFRVTTTDTLRTLCGHSADFEPPSNVRSLSADEKNAADTDQGSAAHKPASAKVKGAVISADTTEAEKAPDTETEIETEKKAGPPSRSAPVVPLSNSAGTRELVAHFVDAHRELTGEPAPERLVGQVARQVDELRRDGVSSPTIARALVLMVEKRLGPATLPSLVAEAAAGPRRDREHPADRLVRDLLEDGP